MRFCTVQLHRGEEKLLEHLTIVEAVIRKNLSVQCDIVRPVVSPFRTVNPYCGSVEGESGGSTIARCQGECSVVIVPRPVDDPHQKLSRG